MPAFKHFLKRPLLLFMAVALLVLGGISLNRILTYRTDMQTHVLEDLEAQIGDRVSVWESRVTDQLEQWLDTAAVDPTATIRVQSTLRKRQPWFDSLYLFIPQRMVQLQQQQIQVPGTFLFPQVAPKEDTESLQNNPCIMAARVIWLLPDADPVLVASAFMNGCTEQPVAVRLVAATEAATLLARARRFDQAIKALDTSGLSADLPVRRGIEQGIAPFRVVVNRTQRGQLLMELGRKDEALDLYEQTGLEITALDAPSAEGVLTYVRWPVIAELRNHGRIKDAQRMEILLSRAERRVRAWREIQDRILPRSSADAGSARFIYDQYERQTPFLLYYGAVREGEMGAAIALDQPSMVADFLSSMRRYHRYITIMDSDDNYVAGVRGGGEIVAKVPFSRTLSHLSVGMRQSALDSELARLPNQWVIPIIVVVFVMILGTLAIYGQTKASANSEALLLRQRAFTTRVTHELKTPLAGIRVMAENLEDGIWRDEAHRAEMAGRIVEEADRLTRRIDEVLNVARERTVPNPEPFDPEEIAFMLIEDWGPRMEQAGIVLHAEPDLTDEIKGDPNAVRDAVACLLDNAIKYANESRADRQVWFTVTQEGKEVLFRVSDNGLGVPNDMRKSIFQQFVRVEGSNRGKSGGHGLGLSQVAQIAKAHQGRVDCTDGVDGGACFTLRIPALG